MTRARLGLFLAASLLLACSSPPRLGGFAARPSGYGYRELVVEQPSGKTLVYRLDLIQLQPFTSTSN